MNISLKNIGIVRNSSIELAGLTVITGQNNSGKTTVGKVLYSVLDAVSNLHHKASNDKYRYALNQLDRAREFFEMPYALSNTLDADPEGVLDCFFMQKYRDEILPSHIKDFLSRLNIELGELNMPIPSINPTMKELASKYSLVMDPETFNERRNRAVALIEKTLADVERDPNLIDYARRSIDETLQVEFAGQIQPVAQAVESSQITIFEDGDCCFDIKIADNRIVNEKKQVFLKTSYRNTYFIDNPFVMDNVLIPRTSYRFSNVDNESFINTRRITTHENKLKSVLHSKWSQSIFEENVIDDNLGKIKGKINDILPGEFFSSNDGEFYVCENAKLKTSNLATGSKMFSIIKLLLQKGKLDEETMLILDEPEAHLHPSWQNKFAEIIVLLVKELKVNILLTTHSSNFMLAIDAYMRKYEISDVCNFYQTKHYEGEIFVDYHCVNDDMNVIYQDFLQYLSEVKRLRSGFLTDDED